MTKTRNTPLGAVLVALCCTVGQATAMTFTPLGDLPGGSFFSRAFGVSAEGSVVVGQSNSSSGLFEPFRWTSNGGMVGLGDLPGGSFSDDDNEPIVSANGSVVVGQGNSSSGFEAFRWTNEGGMVGLGDLPGGTFTSSAWGVSADGSVVVGASNSASGDEAFRWTSGGGMVGLGYRPGGSSFSSSEDVSADGSVIVGASNSASGLEAFRWTSDGGMVGLGDLPGGSFGSVAVGVSADGAVVIGFGNLDDATGSTEAFRWTSGGGMVGLGDLTGGIFSSIAQDVSDDGSVVVGSGNSALGDEAFLWTSAGGMQNLRELLIAGGATGLTGWTLTQASAVSADGRTIVGYGRNPSGQTEGWLAIIPEPSSLLLCVLGTLALLLRRVTKTRKCLIAALLIGLLSSPVWGAPTEMISFGDSLTDVGNLYVDSGRTVPSPPYFNGRFSNGPVWVERLAGHLNLPAPAPSLSGGANYAWGGAETGSGLSFYDTPNVGMQIDSYLGLHTPANTTLFTVWAGANDLFGHQSDPTPFVANLSGHLSKLAAAGGQHFLVGNLPPLGKFPSVLGTPASSLLDALTVQFNNLLSSELDNLQSSLGVTIYRLDAYNIYQSILANPAAYGLTNVTKPAFNDITVVPNPDQYLFWDGDHPTRVVSQLLGDAAAALVQVLTGDFNDDGSVDAADYVVWRNGLGTIYTQNDYEDWRTHFGQTGGSRAALPVAEPLSASVPEPTTALLCLLTILVRQFPRRVTV